VPPQDSNNLIRRIEFGLIFHELQEIK